MQSLLRLQDILLTVTSDNDLVPGSWQGSSRSVAKDGREEGRKVDGSVGDRLDQLDVASLAAADKVVQGKLKFDGVNLSSKLVVILATSSSKRSNVPYNLVNHDK